MATACNSVEEPGTLSTFVSSISSTTGSQGGFDYELLGGVDSRYECPICLLYMRDPVITSCGHRFCFYCISQWVLNHSNPNGCPVDGGNLSHENIFPDNYTRREILACKAKCPYLKEGCSVILPLAEMDKHIGLEHTLSLESSSLSSMKLNGSFEKSPGNGLVECKFKEVGCDHVVPADQLARHLDSNVHNHLQLVAASYKRLKRILQVSDLPPPPEFVRQDSRDSTRPLLLEEGDDSEYNFRRQRSWDSVRFARRYFSGSRAYLHDRLVESDESLPKHSSGCSDKEVTSSMSCQSLMGTGGGSSSSTTTTTTNNSYQLKDLFERLVRLEQNDREKQIKIDRLEARLSSAVDLCSKVTTLMDDLTARYCNGTFVWKLSGFTARCKQMRSHPTFYEFTPGFYTDTFGYKLFIRFTLFPKLKETNGSGGAAPAVPSEDVPLELDETTTVGLYAHFLQGEFDNCVEWPFRGQLKFIIVHPSNPEASVIETMTAKPEIAACARPKLPRAPTGVGFPDVCSLKKIFSGGFLSDDTLTVKIVAKGAQVVGGENKQVVTTTPNEAQAERSSSLSPPSIPMCTTRTVVTGTIPQKYQPSSRFKFKSSLNMLE